MAADALQVEIEESENGAGKRNGRVTGRRFQKTAGESAHEVSEENEYGNRADEGDHQTGTVMDVFFEKVLNAEAEGIGEQDLRDLLQTAGLFDGKPRTQQESEYSPENQDDDSHHDVFGDGQFRIFGLDVQGIQQDQSDRPKQMIYEARQPSYLFSHSSACRT